MKLNVFKKIIVSILVLIAVALGLVVYGFLSATPPENDLLLFDDYYIYRFNSLNCKIYQKDFFDSENGCVSNKNIYNGWIYKYSFDSKNKSIIMHTMNGVDMQLNELDRTNEILYNRFYGGKEYAITEDIWILYDGKTGTSNFFNSDMLLNDYCKQHSIALNEWYYPAGNGFVKEEKTNISDNCYIKTWLYGYSSLILNGEELVFGYITDVKQSGNIVSFRLRQTMNEYSPENINANSMLSSVSDKPIGKYRDDFLTYLDIYYDKRILVNIESGEVTET